LLDRIQLTYSSAEDGISWSEKNFWLHNITVSYDPREKSGQSVFTLEEAPDTSL